MRTLVGATFALAAAVASVPTRSAVDVSVSSRGTRDLLLRLCPDPIERADPSFLGITSRRQVRAATDDQPDTLWRLAQQYRGIHRYSTLFPAQDVRDRLSTPAGLDAAVAWCKATGVTKAYVESYRDGYQAEAEALKHARDRFLAEGIEVSGCVTTTKIGKPTRGFGGGISCYTDQAAQAKLQAIFEFTAALFNEIMIDDFWFTDCYCPDCNVARTARTVTIGDRKYPVNGDTWDDYRCELMTRLSTDRILEPAKRVNPRVKVIIKYPQWYDDFHLRGYVVDRETAAFDRIWVGTETRDYTSRQWGGTVQYEGYFIMRWLGGIGGSKCGGGWFDPYGTSPETYIEQARQTILGCARESLLFCYGSLVQGNGPRNIAAIRAELPELLSAAREVRRRAPAGIAAYKPPNSQPGKEHRVFDFAGMLGFPLLPCHTFPSSAKAAFFSVHALKDPDLDRRLEAFIASGKPVLITDGLAEKLRGRVAIDRPNVHILPVHADPKSLLVMPELEVRPLREAMLRPFGIALEAPNRVALYLFTDGSWVGENFNDEPVTARLNGEPVPITARGWALRWKGARR